MYKGQVLQYQSTVKKPAANIDIKISNDVNAAFNYIQTTHIETRTECVIIVAGEVKPTYMYGMHGGSVPARACL